MSEKWVFPLSYPLEAHDQEITELTMRDPTAGDFAACGGEPWTTNMLEMTQEGHRPQVDFKDGQMLTLISRLAAVPRSTVERMDGADLFLLKWQVANRFFGRVAERLPVVTEALVATRTPETGSTSVSTSPTSGSATRKTSLRSVGQS